MAEEKERSEKTLFKCIYCDASFLLDFTPPEEWTVRRYAEEGQFKFSCPNCGAFIYPAHLDMGEEPNPDLFYMFSSCVNAYDCHYHYQYDPSCERPQLKPKCLHALYMELEHVHRRLDEMEKRLTGRSTLKPGPLEGRKPGSKLN